MYEVAFWGEIKNSEMLSLRGKLGVYNLEDKKKTPSWTYKCVFSKYNTFKTTD